ncbi:outer membrane beta-barrel protein [Hymenobacter cheonanensis]|uniref:outer membrane beta-barrel protein n=1 Tax=Hymenobacter sp. CA2-7 TaxID=3063993 RepID=UPI0027133FFE|nr:outer membrane beta-barrel protein [Hymenobacter sp. CA2-7]MDO7886353.1 TonB-dependent receptor [Hymenobacter sp. CA2-7]
MLVSATLFRLGVGLYRGGGLLTVGVLAVPLASHAQTRAVVRGTVAGPGGAAVEFATVTLHRAADSVVVKTEFSDAQGAFRLDAPTGQRYRVSVAQVGFGRYWSAPFELPAAGLALPAIRLAPSQATALKEVTVTGRKPLYERRADRTVVNVADSPLASGATTLDVLARSPGVSLSSSNELSLRGRQGLLVVIDGKRTPLTGSDLAEYLRSLPAEQLQSLELITNPPASYDAQGGAGVIAINLKKDQRLGTNGTANASYGYSEQGKFTGGLALNHRRKNLNLYGNYAYTDRRYFVRIDLDRRFAPTPALPAGGTVLANDQHSHLRSHAGKVGLDLNLTKRTLLGASASVLASQTNNNIANQTVVVDEQGAPTDRYHARTVQDISRPSGSANLNLRHAFADSAAAATLTADADYARYHLTRLLDQDVYFDTSGQPGSLLSGDQRSTLSIGAAKVDFSQPLPHRTRLDVGAKATRVVSDNDVAFTSTVNGVTSPRPDISSQFSYHENVNAAYASLRGALPRTTLQAGLRAEQTNTLAEQAGITLREQHYLQLFPSALVERTLSERHTLALALARRIDRPSYAQINPLRTYIDATSYLAGNPNLVASTSYNFELTHTYRQKFSTGLAYSRTDLPIVNVVQPAPDGGRLVVSQNVNLRTRHFYTLTLTAPLTLTKWWALYANALVYYNRYVGELNGTDLDRGRVACNLTANNSFTLPKGWSAELNGFYESREVYGFQVIQARGQVTAGVQKSLWNKQGTFRLNVADIFYTTPNRVTSTYDNFTEAYYSRLDTRIVTAALTYRFGNSKVAAARRRAAGADEELRRAAGQ